MTAPECIWTLDHRFMINIHVPFTYSWGWSLVQQCLDEGCSGCEEGWEREAAGARRYQPVAIEEFLFFLSYLLLLSTSLTPPKTTLNAIADCARENEEADRGRSWMFGGKGNTTPPTWSYLSWFNSHSRFDKDTNNCPEKSVWKKTMKISHSNQTK